MTSRCEGDDASVRARAALDSLAPAMPAVHLAPPRGWMNDPNGLVFLDGVYHAFYQHHPSSDVWGPMHWGHATSVNLLAWEDRGVAMSPDHLGAIFSGSAVVDHGNSSGLGADGIAPVVAVFTHDSDAGQRQSLAYSIDRGATFEKYVGNPILGSDEKDFRDPKVCWSGSPDDGHWVMSIAVDRRIEFYRSADLRTWSKSGEFTATFDGSSGVWECPDLISIEREGTTKWVLLVATAEAGPGVHSGVVAFVGDFDGARFRSEEPAQALDEGPDFYAAQSFANVPGDPLVLGWMNSWQYANTIPSNGRRGVMSLPRRLGLDGGRVTQRLTFDHAGRPIVSGARLHSAVGEAFDLVVGDAVVRIGSEANPDAASIVIEPDTIRLSRSTPGSSGLDGTFAAERRTPSPVRVVIDHGTIEIFADAGATVLNALYFAGETFSVVVDREYSCARLTARGPRPSSVDDR